MCVLIGRMVIVGSGWGLCSLDLWLFWRGLCDWNLGRIVLVFSAGLVYFVWQIESYLMVRLVLLV